MREFLLPLLGFAVGALGTLVGAGGGFLLGPVLLFAYPNEPAKALTSISLAIAFVNALSGSGAYAVQRRIDYRTGALFAAATVPSSVAGVYAVRFIPRTAFDALFGLLLLAVASLLLARPARTPRERVVTKGEAVRVLVDRYGHTFRWSFRPRWGAVLSVGIGFLSSVLGIGGGVIHVPMMVLMLGFPIHIATATSQFILLFTALTATITHIAAGDFAGVWQRTLLIGSGVLLGAQAGGAMARRVRPVLITRVLGIVMGLVGIRLVFTVMGA